MRVLVGCKGDSDEIRRTPVAKCPPPILAVLAFAGLGFFRRQGCIGRGVLRVPTGSDSNPGTQASPWGTVQKAASTAVAGDTVWFRGGTYSPSAGITFSKSGTSDTNRINYFAYQGEVPKIDFSNMNVSSTGYSMGITVSGSWLHFKGIEECCLKETTFANNGFDVSGQQRYL